MILKSKWEDVGYLSENTQESSCDQIAHWNKEQKNKIFIFLREFSDDYMNIRSQILNGCELSKIEKVYFKVEAEEQRKSMMVGKMTAVRLETKNKEGHKTQR